MDRTVARLHEEEPAFDWVGIYLLVGDTLVLGPYRGNPTDHDRIPVGDGVCGTVATTGETEVVPDAFGDREVRIVEEAAGEIAAGA